MYNNISAVDTAFGANIGGIFSFLFVPKEWLATDVAIDVISGTVKVAPTLIAGKSWISGQCVAGTAGYEEKDKNDRGNVFIEATLSGVVHKDEAARAVNLATLRYHELVVIYTDINKQRRIIGNKAKAMSFAQDYTTGKAPADSSLFNISLVHQMADPAPIYEA